MANSNRVYKVSKTGGKLEVLSYIAPMISQNVTSLLAETFIIVIRDIWGK
jgi:hypothetical protein